MKLEDIQSLWEKDGPIDQTELGREASDIPRLHAKYLRMFVEERMVLRRLEADLRTLKLEKHEFYTSGETKETRERGWKMPARGAILRTDVGMYLESDAEMTQLMLRVELQKEKVGYLEGVVKQVNNRNFMIKSIQDWLKWTQGSL